MKEIKFNEKYNIIQLKRKNIYEWYIEKIGYGSLFYMIGCENNVKPKNNYIADMIKIAENNKFWGEEIKEN